MQIKFSVMYYLTNIVHPDGHFLEYFKIFSQYSGIIVCILFGLYSLFHAVEYYFSMFISLVALKLRNAMLKQISQRNTLKMEHFNEIETLKMDHIEKIEALKKQHQDQIGNIQRLMRVQVRLRNVMNQAYRTRCNENNCPPAIFQLRNLNRMYSQFLDQLKLAFANHTVTRNKEIRAAAKKWQHKMSDNYVMQPSRIRTSPHFAPFDCIICGVGKRIMEMEIKQKGNLLNKYLIEIKPILEVSREAQTTKLLKLCKLTPGLVQEIHSFTNDKDFVMNFGNVVRHKDRNK